MHFLIWLCYLYYKWIIKMDWENVKNSKIQKIKLLTPSISSLKLFLGFNIYYLLFTTQLLWTDYSGWADIFAELSRVYRTSLTMMFVNILKDTKIQCCAFVRVLCMPRITHVNSIFSCFFIRLIIRLIVTVLSSLRSFLRYFIRSLVCSFDHIE